MILTYSIALVASWARMRRNGSRTYKDPKARSAQDAHTLAMRAALSRSGLAWDPCGRFVVTVVYHPADNRARDTDRISNLVLDAGEGVLWRKDSDRHVIDQRSAIADEDGVALVVWHGAPRVPSLVWLGQFDLLPPVERGHTLVIVERVGDAKQPRKRAKRA